MGSSDAGGTGAAPGLVLECKEPADTQKPLAGEGTVPLRGIIPASIDQPAQRRLEGEDEGTGTGGGGGIAGCLAEAAGSDEMMQPGLGS